LAVSKQKVINIWGGPGSGKSTTAAGLYYMMKCRGYDVELVREFAKDLVYAGKLDLLAKQEAVSAIQVGRQGILRGKVKYIITDSPILLGLHYGESLPLDFRVLLRREWDKYDSANVLLTRVKPYHTNGRVQTEEEAVRKDLVIGAWMVSEGVPHIDVDGDRFAPERILHLLEPWL
jgi:hypothetical protein